MIETLAPLSELLITIGIFTGILVLLNGLLGYVDENTLYGRIEIRPAIIGDIREKACTTSYPHITDPDVQKLKEKAMDACSSNSKRFDDHRDAAMWPSWWEKRYSGTFSAAASTVAWDSPARKQGI